MKELMGFRKTFNLGKYQNEKLTVSIISNNLTQGVIMQPASSCSQSRKSKNIYSKNNSSMKCDLSLYRFTDRNIFHSAYFV